MIYSSQLENFLNDHSFSRSVEDYAFITFENVILVNGYAWKKMHFLPQKAFENDFRQPAHVTCFPACVGVFPKVCDFAAIFYLLANVVLEL